MIRNNKITEMSYFVEYMENDGTISAEHWTQHALNRELELEEVKIISIVPSYHILVALGLAEDE